MLLENEAALFRHLKLREFRESLSLSSCGSTKIEIFVEKIPGYENLNSWNNDLKQEKTSLNTIETISKPFTPKNHTLNTIEEVQEISKILLTEKEKRLYFTIDAITIDFGRKMYYNSCPDDTCFKKVTLNEEDNQWYCPKCDKNYPNCNPRFMGYTKLADSTGTLYTTINRAEIGSLLLGGRSPL